MRVGGKMIMVRISIINTSSEMIGIGKLIHLTKIEEQILEQLLETVEIIRCRITILFWVLTGN